MDKTYFWCVVGMIFFWVGAALRMYMVVRVNGLAGYLKSQAGVSDGYRKLISESQAPAWPLPTSYLCIALGIATIFGSILTKPLVGTEVKCP
jgi:hypothetical protein